MTTETSGTARITGAVATALVTAGLIVAVATAGRHRASQAPAAPASEAAVWSAAWRTAEQPPSPGGPASIGFTNQTLRLVVRAGWGGQQLRVRLSNRYGTTALAVGAASVALRRVGPIGTAPRGLTFAGSATATIPAGSDLVSDPLPFPTRAGQQLLVNVFLPAVTGPLTGHTLAHVTSYVSNPGNWTAEPGGSPFQTLSSSTFVVDGVDVLGPRPKATVVAFGDSITDGSFSSLDAFATYPDRLAEMLPAAVILNAGIGGNQVLTDTPGGGVSALHRFDADALDQPGVSSVILLEGVNDIGAGASAGQLSAALTTLVERAHARCVAVVGATITPFAGSVYDTPAHRQVRDQVNSWIRTAGAFDGLADFDAALRDPADPEQLAPDLHTVGDLHPNDEGYQRMAEVARDALRRVGKPCRTR